MAAGGKKNFSHHGERASQLRRLVRLLVIVMVAVLSGLALYFWSRTEQAAVSQFHRNAAMLAKLGARRVEQILFRIGLAFQGMMETKPGEEWKHSSQRLVEDLRDLGALGLASSDDSGQLDQVVGISAEVAQDLLGHVSEWCQNGKRQCFGLAGTTSFGSSGKLAFIAEHDAAGRLVMMVFDWKLLGDRITDEVSLGPEGLAWLVDQSGRLLYHPSNPAVCNEGLQQQDARCSVCHGESEPSTPVVPNQTTVGLLSVEGVERRLVAFSQVSAFGENWVLGLGVPYLAVVSDYRRVLRVAVLLSGVLIGLFMLVSYLLDRENRRQLVALHKERHTIARLNRELEDKVKERTAKIEQLYRELSEFRHRHENWQRLAIVGELAAMVAHETRNPLNALGLGAERLLRNLDAGGELSDKQKIRRITQGMLGEIRRIGRFVDDYLRLARPQRRNPRPVDLCGLAREVGRFIEMEAQRQNVAIKLSLPAGGVTAEVDADQVRQVLLNLMLNSLQAMPAGGTVAVSVSRENGLAVIQVADTGPGIPAENLERIFEPFFSSRENGTGLGLAISKRIVTEHGGKIECKSEVGHGTVFQFAFPLDRAPRKEPDKPAGG